MSKIVRFICLLILMLSVSFTACEREGPAERAGESIDEASESVGEAVEDAGERAD